MTDSSTGVPEPAPAAASPPKGGRKQGSLWRELPVLLAVAIGLAFVFKTFFLAVFFIPSASMEKTLIGSQCTVNASMSCTGDRVVVNKLVYDFRDPHRGEIVVFNGKGNGFGDIDEGAPAPTGVGRDVRKALSIVGLGSDPNEKDFIKRVVAVGGDVISCPGMTGDKTKCDGIIVNGHKVDESAYLFENGTNGSSYVAPDQMPFAACTVPKGDLFVMGDHRDDSEDSRYKGPIPVSAVIGRAFATVYPVGRFGGLGVPKVWQGDFAPTAGAGIGAPVCNGGA